MVDGRGRLCMVHRLDLLAYGALTADVGEYGADRRAA
jgi:hypothetical protein